MTIRARATHSPTSLTISEGFQTHGPPPTRLSTVVAEDSRAEVADRAAIPRVPTPSTRSRARRANEAAIAAAGGIPNTVAASR